MKQKFFTIVFMLMLSVSVFSQSVDIVISEISYNTPGEDLEYIEIYNRGTAPADMTGYVVTEGFDYTFPEVTIGVGEYFLLVQDSVRFDSIFGIAARQWTGGGLKNSGEDIEIRTPDSLDVVAYVNYDDSAPWPTECDGDGPSLVICDVNGDMNDPANWGAAQEETGEYIAEIQLLGSPGAASVCSTEEPTYPEYGIGLVTTVNEDGVVDSLDVKCTLQGVVYGVNMNSSGLLFTIIDADNDGIAVYSSDPLGYEVNQGDEVKIKGRISQYKGLAQIKPDEIELIASGQPLFDPTVVTALGEETESQLIKITNLTLVDPSQWPAEPSGSGFNVEVTDGTNTYMMRVDNDTEVFAMAAPTGAFDLTGIGGQYDGSIPYTEGYQIFPRYNADINIIEDVNDNALSGFVRLSPNPVTATLNLNTDLDIISVKVFNVVGQEVLVSAAGEKKIDVNDLDSGVYFITLSTEKGVGTFKFVKK